MADKASVLAKIDAARIEVQGLGGVITPPPPPPPPPPPIGDISWYTSKASGSITNVGSNLLHALNPNLSNMGSSGFYAIMGASGGVFAPTLGPIGSFIQSGGGHDDWYGNDVYAFDLATQTWSQLKAPHTPLFLVNNYHADNMGRLFADATGSTVHSDQPSSRHNYGHCVFLPPGMGHNDPIGAKLFTVLPSLTKLGQKGAGHAWIFTLSDRKYALYSTNPTSISMDYSHSFLDEQRRRVVVHGYGCLWSLDLNTRVYTKLPPLIPGSLTYTVWGHMKALDLYVGVRATHSTEGTFLYVYDPVTNGLTRPNTATAWPNTNPYRSGGGFWSDILGAIVYHHGAGEKELRIVKPSATGNPRTTPWDITVRTFTGDTPALDETIVAGAHCKRLVEVPAANGALWFGRTRSPTQWFKY
jgi:hypothetical protein